MRNDLQIFVLSFGRKKVPTLAHIADKSSVIVLTSEDNAYKDQIDLQGARLMVFDKDDFRWRGLEMMNEESVPNRRSALYAWHYAIGYCRESGIRYCAIFDDDYLHVEAINARAGFKPMLDRWAEHAASFLEGNDRVKCVCAIDTGQMFCASANAYFANIRRRLMTNTCVFDVSKEHDIWSLGNFDFVNSALSNAGSLDMCIRLQTICIVMENIKDKKHETIDYSKMFIAKWAAVMAAPAYTDVVIKSYKANKVAIVTRYISNSAPKIVSL